MKIGNTLTALRNKRGLTQDQIADVLEIKRARYNSWENDIAKPSIEMLDKIADFYGVRTDDILGRSYKENYPADSEDGIDALDPEIKILQRAAKNMAPKDKKKMVNLVKAAFEEAFKEDEEE